MEQSRTKIQHSEDVQQHLHEVQLLLSRYPHHSASDDNAEDDSRAPIIDGILQQQHTAELASKLEQIHSADIAFILEALPLEDRLAVWDLVKTERDGEILLEVSDAVRESLIESMDRAELVAAAEHLDTDELADLAPDLPKRVMEDVYLTLDPEEREQLRAAMSYVEGSVGSLMDFEMVSVLDEDNIESALNYLRRLDELPHHTDQLFVIDAQDHLQGVLPISRLLTSAPNASIRSIMLSDPLCFSATDKADKAAKAFERYDLVSAPVVDNQHKLKGRLTVATVVDYIRESSENELLGKAGLKEEEDIFAPVIDSVKNRWSWLAINLVTAFIASRVIGLFEGSIAKLVALATLMPIVAGIGGNSGNQTTTMIVRAIATGQFQPQNAAALFRKEAKVALINGLVWGGLLGLIAWALYHDYKLGLVMTGAMILNLLLAATVGVMIPTLMASLGRDPAVGSSVMLTACTDSGGFFIFLGLATLFLL